MLLVDAVADARPAAAKIGVPHYASASTILRDARVDKFVSEYARGRTPNPCAKCNRTVKFDELLRQARGLARRPARPGTTRGGAQPATGRYELREARASRRDQSYRSYTLTQTSSPRPVFPLGASPTSPSHGRSQGLWAWAWRSKPDSQESASSRRAATWSTWPNARPRPWLPGRSWTPRAGLGEHAGIATYTIGQRAGFQRARRARCSSCRWSPDTDGGGGPESALYVAKLRGGGCELVVNRKLTGPLAVRHRIRL